MRIRMKSIRSLILIAFLIVSCNQTEEPKLLDPTKPYFAIEDNFHMDVFEKSSDDSSNISYFEHELVLTTEQIYGCCNFSIIANQSSSPNNIVLEIDSIFKPSICLTALGPASYRESINLEENGSTVLSINNGSFINRFKIIVSDSLLYIDPIDTSYVKSTESYIWRFKNNSFVYSCGTTEETSWIYEAFKDSILSLTDVKQFFYPDYGRIPYQRSPSGYWVNHPCLFFTYNSEASWDKLKDMLVNYSINTLSQQMGVGVYIQNNKGEREWSWRYD